MDADLDADLLETAKKKAFAAAGAEIAKRSRNHKPTGDKKESDLPAVVWPSIIQIADDLLPVEKFHPDLLPDVLRPWAVDAAHRMDDAPLDFFAVGIVVALGALIGNRASVQPKRHDNWTVVPNLWGGGIGRPATLKTPKLKEAMKFSRHLEAEAYKSFEEALVDYNAGEEADRFHKKAMESDLKKAAKVDREKAKSMLLAMQDDGEQAPVRRRYIVADATIEKLGELLKDNPTGLLMFRDELTGWLTALDREGREQDRAFYLEAWNGNSSYSWDRIGRGTTYIPHVVISVLGGIQPAKLYPYVRSMRDGAGDDGLLQRFQLLVWPDAGQPVHVDQSPDTASSSRIHELFATINALPEGGVVRFDNDGQEIFDRWYSNMLEKETAETNAHIESHLVKYHSLFPALALIFEIVETGSMPLTVGMDAASRALAWCRYLETHARRIYSLIDSPLDGARVIAGRLHHLPNPFKLKTIANKGWSGLTSTAQVRAALDELCKRNYIIDVEEQTGGRPSLSYFINPAALELATDDDD
jgi:putative DNA primase/helicase